MTAIMALAVFRAGFRLGVPRLVILRMTFNILLDLGLGLLPGIGDLADAGFKSNRRNLALLRKHADQPAQARRSDVIFFSLLALGVFTIIGAVAYFSWLAALSVIGWILR